MSFRLMRCTDRAAWDRFAASSPQGNVFCSTPFLQALGEEFELLFVEDGSSPVLGVIRLSRDGTPLRAPYPLTMYQGLLWAEEVAALPSHSRTKHGLEAIEYLLSELEKEFARISFCLHHRFEDLRGFSWFHYHEPERGRFQIDLRYTGLLDLLNVSDFESYLASIRTTRRQEYRKAERLGFAVEPSQDLDLLIQLHQRTFERQGIQQDASETGLVRSIAAAALAGDFGQLFVCKDANGLATCATFFLHDERCAYYWVAANDPEYRNTGGSTYLMLENIRRYKEAGKVRTIDFVGINSPNRGDFKTSFNAQPAPYFVVNWERPA